MNRTLWQTAGRTLAVLVLLLSLVACSPFSPSRTTAETAAPAPNGGAAFGSAEELLAILEASEEKTFDRASEWLAYWGFPAYSAETLNLMELYYRNYYVGELPSVAVTARRLAEAFAGYMSLIELSESEAVTDLVMECYLAAVEDKYAYYMNAETFSDYMEDMSGDFVGIGVRVIYSSVDKTVEIVSVMKDTPAMQAGLAPGDLILAVDGKTVEELSYYEIVDRIRGKEGTEVSVTVLRDGASLTLRMERRRLIQTTVEHKVLGSVGYLHITEFDETTYSQFQAAFESLRAVQGVGAIVFDVRDNPGGALDAILRILDYMVPDRDGDGARVALASYLYYDGTSETDYASDGQGAAVGLPLAVITNEYTASAGELFASALKDYGERGLLDVTVVGQTTYGKGTMQALYRLPGGRATTVSIALYNPPYSGNYEGLGVIPDTLAALSPEAAKKSLYQLTAEEDTQLAAALSALGAGNEIP